MDDIARGFRESRLNVLELIANPGEQRNFAAGTFYGDYSSKFYCWWFDDFHPTSDLFERAFLPNEIEILRIFSTTWERQDSVLGQTDWEIEGLLSNDNWCSVIEAAKQAAVSLKRGAT